MLVIGTHLYVYKSKLTVNGGWTDWADSTICSASCGNGTKGQVRFCANPIPEWGGANCAGMSEQTVNCSNGDCTESGNFFVMFDLVKLPFDEKFS